MRLADFLLLEMESILREWEDFAATNLPATARLSPQALRDHAPDILRAIALDLQTFQTADQQDQKAKGRSPQVPDAANTAAQTHALLRARDGFTMVQMAGEPRPACERAQALG